MIQVQVLNREEVKKFLENKNEEVKKKVSQAMFKASELMRNEVKESIAGRRNEPTSVDTGRFLNSVDTNISEDNAIVFTKVEYAQYLEYGTSRMQARRHFNNSLDRNRNQVVKKFEESIKEI